MGSPRHAWPIAPVSNEIVPSNATAGASRFVDSDELGQRPEGDREKVSVHQTNVGRLRRGLASTLQSGWPGVIADAGPRGEWHYGASQHRGRGAKASSRKTEAEGE